jgi:hypothetical protein
MKSFLCYIGIHRYKDYFHLGKSTNFSVPFTSEERCKCGKVRNKCSGTMELPMQQKRELQGHWKNITKGNQDD